jgi:hypothetical protein
MGQICFEFLNLTALLQTPAVFWVTNANNYVVNNRAIASRRYGIWYRPEISATGSCLSLFDLPYAIRFFNNTEQKLLMIIFFM